MADPYKCLRGSSIVIAIWNIIYSIIQMGIMGWQIKEVKDMQWEYENRQIPVNGFVDGFQARFPGLYALYTETPERRRINAMYVIVLICEILAIVHLIFSVSMLYGAIKRDKSWIFPWLFSCGAIVIMSTAYAVLWWSGDVFNEQLVMSVAEFVMSLAINGVCLIVVIFYYIRLAGGLTSDKPKEHHGHGGHRRRSSRRHRSSVRYIQGRSPCHNDQMQIPPWRTEWTEEPPKMLHRKMRRREAREEREFEKKRRKEMWQKGIDLGAPEPQDPEFPWKLPPPQLEDPRYRPTSAGSVIRELYYEDFPDERSEHGPRSRSRPRHRPRGTRGRSLEEVHAGTGLKGRSPERVTFSRLSPEVKYRTPEQTPSSGPYARNEPADQHTVV